MAPFPGKEGYKMMGMIFQAVLRMSVTAGYVILLTLLVRLCLKKAPKIYAYLLWTASFFRLVCPVSFESVISLLPKGSQTGESPLPFTGEMFSVSGTGGADPGFVTVTPPLPSAGNPGTDGPSLAQQFWLVAGAIWIAGAVFLMLYSVVSTIMLRRSLYGALPCGGDVYEVQNLKTPFVLGFFRPKIYLPAGISGQERAYILAHERTHIRRRDYLIKPLAFFTVCIHWFNPLVWLAFFLMEKDMEMSCDERVLKDLGPGIKKDYSTSLLSMASGGRFVGGSPLAFGEGSVKSRIKNVLNYKKSAFWIAVAALLTVIGVTIALLANPKSFDYAKAEAQAMRFSTHSSQPLEIGTTAFEHFYQTFQKSNVPDEYRVQDVALKNIEVTAGDEAEFVAAVQFTYTAGEDCLLLEGGVENKEQWQEIRVKSLGQGDYAIVAIGDSVDGYGLLTAGDSQGITVQTEGEHPVSAQFGRTLWRDIEVTPQVMENELYTMKGFSFSVSEAEKGIWLGLRFSGQKPISSGAVGLIVDGQKKPDAYPSRYIGYDVLAPDQPGRYHVYIDLTWPDGTPETIYFPITIWEGVKPQEPPVGARERSYSVVTDNSSPISCEFGIDRDGVSTVDLLGKLSSLNGFYFEGGSTDSQYLKLEFHDEKPESVYLRLVDTSARQEEYPIDSETYRIKVPDEIGWYNFFADITWADNTTETAYFWVKVTEDIFTSESPLDSTIDDGSGEKVELMGTLQLSSALNPDWYGAINPYRVGGPLEIYCVDEEKVKEAVSSMGITDEIAYFSCPYSRAELEALYEELREEKLIEEALKNGYIRLSLSLENPMVQLSIAPLCDFETENSLLDFVENHPMSEGIAVAIT